MGFAKDALQFLNGFRKFTIMALVLVVGVLFRVWGFVNGAEFVDLLSTTAVAFFGTNAAEHLIKTVGQWLGGKATSAKK